MATDDEIPDRLSADNTYFKSLLDMIPPRYYFDEETKQQFRKETEQDTETEGLSCSSQFLHKTQKCIISNHVGNLIQNSHAHVSISYHTFLG